MPKLKKKLTKEQLKAKKLAKAERQKKYIWVFRNGKQVRELRPQTIDGISVEKFILNNADPIWLHQNEMWEYIGQQENDSKE
jgi:sugar-specific transcriptional regulator TrmB